MVAVDDSDPPQEAKIKIDIEGMPQRAMSDDALPKGASARGASTDAFSDKLEGKPDEDDDGNTYAYAIAGAIFGRFSKGLRIIMAVRTFKYPRNVEAMLAPSGVPASTTADLAQSAMGASSPYGRHEADGDVVIKAVAPLGYIWPDRRRRQAYRSPQRQTMSE